MKPRQLSRTIIYQHPWVNLYVDKVEFPDGRIVDEHHVLDFETEAVAVLVENDQRELLLVHAYRYPTDTIEWEIPAGGIEDDEPIVAAARREVREESGYDTVDHELIYTYHPINGIANKVFHLVRARATGKAGDFDRNEVQEIRWVSRQEIEGMVTERSIQDGYSLTGLLLHFFMNG